MPEDDREAVAEFIRTKGIALEEHAVERDRLRRAQAAARWRPFLNLKATQ